MEQKYGRVVVVGSLGFDHVMKLPGRVSDFIMPEKIDRMSVSFTVDTLRKEFGGTGGNCAYSLGLLQVDTVLVGAWGKDAEAYREHLEVVGVDVSQIMVDPNLFSAYGHVMTDIDGNQIWMYYPGPLKRMSEIELRNVVAPKDLVVLMPSEPKAFAAHLKEILVMRTDFVFDPAFFVPNLSGDEILSGIDNAKIVIGNDYEIELMQQKTGKSLQDWLKGDLIVIETKGEEGSMIWQGNQFYKIPPVKVEIAEDPTGCGDTYRAGFLAGFLRDMPLEVCGKMGAISAAYCVEKPGTQTFGYSIEEFCKRYEENFNEKLELLQ